jgi:hypothetical protein
VVERVEGDVAELKTGQATIIDLLTGGGRGRA